MRLGKPADLFLPTKIVTVLTFLYTGRKKSLFLCTFEMCKKNIELGVKKYRLLIFNLVPMDEGYCVSS